MFYLSICYRNRFTCYLMISHPLFILDIEVYIFFFFLQRILAQEPEESHIFLGFDSYAENANKKKSALKWINGMDQLNSKKKTWAIPTINKSSRSRNGLTREYWEKQRLESSDTLIKYILFCEVKINRENLHCKKEKKKESEKQKSRTESNNILLK